MTKSLSLLLIHYRAPCNHRHQRGIVRVGAVASPRIGTGTAPQGGRQFPPTTKKSLKLENLKGCDCGCLACYFEARTALQERGPQGIELMIPNITKAPRRSIIPLTKVLPVLHHFRVMVKLCRSWPRGFKPDISDNAESSRSSRRTCRQNVLCELFNVPAAVSKNLVSRHGVVDLLEVLHLHAMLPIGDLIDVVNAVMLDQCGCTD